MLIMKSPNPLNMLNYLQSIQIFHLCNSIDLLCYTFTLSSQGNTNPFV